MSTLFILCPTFHQKIFSKAVKYIYTGQLGHYKVCRYDGTKSKTDNNERNAENNTETKSDTGKTKENKNEQNKIMKLTHKQ